LYVDNSDYYFMIIIITLFRGTGCYKIQRQNE